MNIVPIEAEEIKTVTQSVHDLFEHMQKLNNLINSDDDIDKKFLKEWVCDNIPQLDILLQFCCRLNSSSYPKELSDMKNEK